MEIIGDDPPGFFKSTQGATLTLRDRLSGIEKFHSWNDFMTELSDSAKDHFLTEFRKSGDGLDDKVTKWGADCIIYYDSLTSETVTDHDVDTGRPEDGVCWAFDYNDNGDRYCSQFYTMEEVKKYHVDYRKACANVNVESPINICEASAYLKDGEKMYYASIKICRKLDGEDEGSVRFMNMVSTKFNKDGYKATHYEKHPGTCLDNIDRWKLFPWSTPKPPVITVRETWNH